MNTFYEIKYEKLNKYFDKNNKKPTDEELKQLDNKVNFMMNLIKKGVKVCDLQLTQRQTAWSMAQD